MDPQNNIGNHFQGYHAVQQQPTLYDPRRDKHSTQKYSLKNTVKSMIDFEQSGLHLKINMFWLLFEIGNTSFISHEYIQVNKKPFQISLSGYGDFCQIPVLDDKFPFFVNTVCSPKCAEIINSLPFDYMNSQYENKFRKATFYFNLVNTIFAFGVDQNPDFESWAEAFKIKYEKLAAKYPEFFTPDSIRKALISNLSMPAQVDFKISSYKVMMNPIWSQCHITLEPYSAKNLSKLNLLWALRHFPDCQKVISKKLWQINYMDVGAGDMVRLVQYVFFVVAMNSPMSEIEAYGRDAPTFKRKAKDPVENHSRQNPNKKQRTIA